MGRPPKTASAKLCIRCNRLLPFENFYPNKEWRSQQYRDAWCKECAAKYANTKEGVQRYCYENNRLWKESFWDSAVKKSKYILANNQEYLSSKCTEKKKREIEEQTASRQFFGMINMSQFYNYVENIGEDGKPLNKLLDDGTVEEESKPPKYNKKWRGYFTDDEVESMEETYAQYEEDFVLDSENMRDYARKVVKASLSADIAEDNYRRGKITASEYKEAQRIFDDLSKSANFAACKRKPGETSGMGSLGEIIMRIELNGELNENGFTFPPDDVDKIIADFRHTLEAVGTEGRL